MADRVIVSVGTRRGLFLFESNKARSRWNLRGPFLKGWQVFHAMVDTRSTPRLYAGGTSVMLGTSVFAGDLKGKNLRGAKRPPVPPKLLPKAEAMATKWGIPKNPQVWHVEPGHSSEKNVVYAGTAPAGLFRSEDQGKTWEEIKSLTNHPSRKHWNPGAGGMCLHSIQIDPNDCLCMYVAISAAGSFRTDDGGRTWKVINRGVLRYQGAPKNEEVGTCVHKILLHPSKPGRLYQQNHVGVYRSDNRGESWDRIDRGLPSDFGFGLAIDPHDAETCFVIPLQTEEYMFRATPGKLGVYKRHGRGWKGAGRGLPTEGAYLNVLREGMGFDALKPSGLYFGTATGQLFNSPDGGRNWSVMAHYLPPILSVSAAVV